MRQTQIRSGIVIDTANFGFPGRSDWQVKEKLSVIPYGEEFRTDNGEGEILILDGFKKMQLSMSGSKARIPPAFLHLNIGDQATIVPVEVQSFWIPAGATTITLPRLPYPGSISLRDDTTGAGLVAGTDWTQGAAPNQRIISLAVAHANPIHGRWRIVSNWYLADRSADFDVPSAEGSWDMTWKEV